MEERAHGATPGLRRDYGMRTAEQQAAFVLPHLRPGMRLLDVGCGPGSISIGLARAVAPGHVTGIDHDEKHIEAACRGAAAAGVTNVTFRVGDALSLPFENDSFDVVFENNVFIHLAEDAARAAVEIHRVLKPNGLFAARDVDTDSVVWGHRTNAIRELNQLFVTWQRSRGSDTTLGSRLPDILREAGFADVVKSVSADTKGDPESVRSHAAITVSLLEGPFGRDALENDWVDLSTIERLKDAVQEWGEHPDAFFGNVHVEVVGWKRELSVSSPS
ncbi:MAG: methyltransferase domain-containing protein [Gemmatimonadota bacterium]